MRFQNRRDAGRQLARLLEPYRNEHPLVLGLPRGGVEVAYEVARALEAPLDVWVVRKISTPERPELGIGAVAEGGIVYVNEDAAEALGVSTEEVVEIARRKLAEVEERVRRFLGDRPRPDVQGRPVILVDDGIATGGTVYAALAALRGLYPGKLILAVPVAATETLALLRDLVDDIVCLEPVPYLVSVGAWYEDFTQTSDEEVATLLRRAREERRGDRQEVPAPG